jgi:AcrR family transcriptional regulator
MSAVEDLPVRPGRTPAASARQIQAEAVRLFTERGYAEVNVEDIAESLGVGRTTIFRYFGSKGGLIWKEVEGRLERLAPLLEADTAEFHPVFAVVHALLQVSLPQEVEPAFERARFSVIGATPELEAERGRFSDRSAEIIAAFVRAHSDPSTHPAIPAAMGFAFMGVMTSVLRNWASSKTGDSLAELMESSLTAVAALFEQTIVWLPRQGELGLQ